jgi:hypothetical protein
MSIFKHYFLNIFVITKACGKVIAAKKEKKIALKICLSLKIE